MLTLLSPPVAGSTRRGFLRAGALGLGGLTLSGLLQARASQPARKDTAVILYWLAGGPSHIDTYDPKPNAPAEVRGPFATRPTRVPGMHFTELLPGLCTIANRLSVIRSLSHHEFNHPDASHLVQTGYHEKNVQFRGQIYPAQGSIVAKIRGSNARGIPAYSCIPSAYFARQGFFQLATYLGAEFNPVDAGGEPTFRFTPAKPEFALAPDLTVNRVDDRRELLRRLDAAAQRHEGTANAIGGSYRAAFDLLTNRAVKNAFDGSLESSATRERYGNNPWGRGAMLARRLVESGVAFVTVNHYEADVDWWDDHTGIEKNLRKRLPPFDRAVSTLIADLHERGLSERVLVVVMGEFGRSPKVDSQAGRGHWAKAMSAVLSGGKVQGGRIVGATTADGGEPATKSIHPNDLLATIYNHLGIDPSSTMPDRQNRPIKLAENGEVIRELF